MSRLVKAAEFLGVGLNWAEVIDLGPGEGEDLKGATKAGASQVKFVDKSYTVCLQSKEYEFVRGDLYDTGIWETLLPCDVIWAYASIAASLWTRADRIDWLKHLQANAKTVMLVPHFSHKNGRRITIIGRTMMRDMKDAGFTVHEIPGVSIEPMCPFVFFWTK